jgi:hypothetical protein
MESTPNIAAELKFRLPQTIGITPIGDNKIRISHRKSTD